MFLLQQLGITDDRGEGGLQVMGHIGDQLHLHPLAAGALLHGGLEPLLNVVQVIRRLGQVVVPGQFQGAGQLPRPDGGNLTGERPQIPPQPALAEQECRCHSSEQKGRQTEEPGRLQPDGAPGPAGAPDQQTGCDAVQQQTGQGNHAGGAAEPLLDRELQLPGGQHPQHSVPPCLPVVPQVVEYQQVQSQEGQNSGGGTGAQRLKEIEEHVRPFPRSIHMGFCLGLNHIPAVRIEGDGPRVPLCGAAADGGRGRGIGRSGRGGDPDAQLPPGEEEQRQKGQEHLDLEPDPAGPPGQEAVRPGLVPAQDQSQGQQQHTAPQHPPLCQQLPAVLRQVLDQVIELGGADIRAGAQIIPVDHRLWI